ncbi:ferredoxin [Nocardia sp. CDC159]|uniref:Ferredoxin n=1 Tax=Nocardia pulmonis TaxID=2951408 RepID=A0A9X2IUV8_9NOCA|nr:MULTISPECIES: ferredoxin [Nocardia]MCM6772553.1 ferredoxin [Nocardia pulmonis]MCM6784789.1 ferredoxin [Nocardia sp. CDC159]
MRVVVNRELCVGHGLCEAAAPELFEVGDDGIARVLRPGVPDESAAATAVADCPARALRIETRDGR